MLGEEAAYPSLWRSPHWSSSGVSPRGGVDRSRRGRTPPVGGLSRATGSSRLRCEVPRSAGRGPGRLRGLLPVARDTGRVFVREIVRFGLIRSGSGRVGGGDGHPARRWSGRSRPGGFNPELATLNSAVVGGGLGSFGVHCLAGGTGRPGSGPVSAARAPGRWRVVRRAGGRSTSGGWGGCGLVGGGYCLGHEPEVEDRPGSLESAACSAGPKPADA
jgi:hypothetical protein